MQYHTFLKTNLERCFIVISLLVLLTTGQASAAKQNSFDCANSSKGGLFGTCGFDVDEVCGNTDTGDDSSPDPGDAGKASANMLQSGLKPPYIIEQWAIYLLKSLAQKKGVDESEAVTKEHVVALIVWAYLEGGDTNNSGKFNLYNTGLSDPALNDGAHTVDGLGAYKSFDAGIEATSRTIAQDDKKPLWKALLSKDKNAKDVAKAESYLGTTPGTTIWAAAAKADPAGYVKKWEGLISQVKSNYKQFASLQIGTDEKELVTNKRAENKLADNINGDLSGDGGTDTESGSNCSSEATQNTTASADAAGVAELAIKLSWPESHGTTPTEAYAQAYSKYNPNGPGIADCGGFVATVMRAGADKNYPPSGTSVQAAYVKAHPEKYDVVSSVSSISDLQPGDIMIVNQGGGQGAAGHTYIYVGNQPPKNYDAASASLGSRAANLGKAILADDRGNYIRARLK